MRPRFRITDEVTRASAPAGEGGRFIVRDRNDSGLIEIECIEPPSAGGCVVGERSWEHPGEYELSCPF